MPHPRQSIRDAVVAALLDQTAAGARVYNARHLPLRRKELPAVLVRSGAAGESADDEQTAPRELMRRYDLEICAVVKADDEDIDATLDDLSLEIEAVMHADPFWGDTVVDSVLVNTEQAEVELDGDRSVGGLVLTYEFTYRTLVPAAPTDLDDFLRVKADHRVNDVIPADQATDEFVVQEVP
jgi:hypothetical protein